MTCRNGDHAFSCPCAVPFHGGFIFEHIDRFDGVIVDALCLGRIDLPAVEKDQCILQMERSCFHENHAVLRLFAILLYDAVIDDDRDRLDGLSVALLFRTHYVDLLPVEQNEHPLIEARIEVRIVEMDSVCRRHGGLFDRQGRFARPRGKRECGNQARRDSEHAGQAKQRVAAGGKVSHHLKAFFG